MARPKVYGSGWRTSIECIRHCRWRNKNCASAGGRKVFPIIVDNFFRKSRSWTLEQEELVLDSHDVSDQEKDGPDRFRAGS